MKHDLLSPAQTRVLRAMQQGSKLTYHTGMRYNGYHDLSSDLLGTRVSSATVSSLEKRGLIKRLPYQIGKFRADFVLTEDGKELNPEA